MYRVPDFLQQGDWAIKIDLKQAYFHIPVARSHQPFLRVLYKTDTTVASAPATVELLQVTSLPFGLSSAPKAFATVSNWVAQLMRNQGLRVVVYLDDYLIVHQERQTLIEHVAEAVRILKILGFTINFEKSALIPSRIVEYLGITWNLATNSKYLPRDKRRRIVTKIQSIVASYSWSLRDAQCVLGMLNFASFVVHRGRLHCRPLQMACVHLPKNKPFTKHSFDQTVLVELEWWIQALSANRSTQIHPLPCTHFLTTDASATGWGAVLDDIRLSGIWHQNQISWHSNVKEMWAIIQAIQELKHLLFNSTVLIQADNKSVVSYIRNQGGLRSRALFQITNMLFHVMDEHNIEMITQYIPGQLNTEADLLSRQKTQTEWYLTEEACREIFDRFGTPVIDLFASRTAHILTRYVSRDCRDLNAEFHNAFSRRWHIAETQKCKHRCCVPHTHTHTRTHALY
ncbi:unnamed protein product [Plutella xylostella]|uniref:(diamondback moth) hypothetical protein n=1 Tax=Plutella xylostella TaxID=51655 RepID=A0A8S4GFX7_PLUXY|nr:unnamed protein product [Plutella xylostella]